VRASDLAVEVTPRVPLAVLGAVALAALALSALLALGSSRSVTRRPIAEVLRAE
jgi:hypothetical protein